MGREWKYLFEWDEAKAAANLRKHDVPFELASTMFHDPQLLTIADLDHSEAEDRWISIGSATNGAILTVVHLWTESHNSTVEVRLISARKATQHETRSYQENL
jgi:uncharacterized DUF497 family protein